ncbi:6-phospho-1-fructokinase [Trypanosoma brucei gambiense DAL972]|uniref:ATP-dependent 6-phosphofructokinase n=5 Tax=Trypanosoma brucei TaxID=5691 RepID=PFKA_TRYBB|nr:6-phospho-1-fructokinase [Trypanosoma brucei gambiense DAL972]XP_843920.1 ATP-dependent phosphofructokinase [Trypanosoma brucei brucei TREU927]O15648.1 RecName: Full=ATP-dependent 6-phosphofructokinase; Short=ATP-PFK; Short=Phosphofructokinase; AltName: Full=Phosphohexokinase [Trypanosoma brucei brucei]2HIG_A Chain A, 6-phospho-1-fructokinase [Trypanosoma brucei]2HIG_B Chain B, 6-phospho-1-fructokinase [Trypanosoma brucei]3F5M_A Chain A, 6-phospho-1-fructokinase (ATP-dependent phosphofructo|eukprot:XP_011772295.1 6-phospho-1-fructokinase [Trypanosoma brucei gambiense DAL972]
MAVESRSRVTSKLVKAHRAMLNSVTQEDLKVDRLPGADYPNPSKKYSSRTEFRDKTDYIMYNPRPRDEPSSENPVSVSPLLCELAAARSRIHFNPTETTIGIVTCGGICPGLNDVIRSITLTGINVYNVKRVIGFRFGYWGLSKKGSQTAIELHRGRVTNIHHYGGTILGSSRGPQDPKEMVDTLERLGVNILFTVGGDGTQRGALVISQEAKRRGVDISVFGVPKTIDNDLSFSHRTFGFQTAVEKAVQAIRAAYAEAVSANYGVGVVKLMGRDSGFIAAQAAVASAQANICLVPENPISEQEVMSLLERRFCHSRSCVIIVAEGFGQDWGRGSGGYDASGNKKLIDIGVILTEKVKAFLKANKSRYPDSTVKYIDPSYMIRACPPSANDALFCATLATLAVHEAMAGATGCIIAMRHNNYILVPIKVATSVRRVLDLRGQLWRQVREITVDLGSDVRLARKLEIRRELEAINRNRDRLHEELAKL